MSPYSGATVFSGTHAVLIDDKGRVAIPARLRAELTKMCRPAGQTDSKIMLCTAPDCVQIYPLPEFERVVEENLAKLPTAKERAVFIRHFVGDALEIDVDDAFRFVVPPAIRQLLGREIKLVGAVKKIQLFAAGGLEASNEGSKLTWDAMRDNLDL